MIYLHCFRGLPSNKHIALLWKAAEPPLLTLQMKIRPAFFPTALFKGAIFHNPNKAVIVNRMVFSFPFSYHLVHIKGSRCQNSNDVRLLRFIQMTPLHQVSYYLILIPQIVMELSFYINLSLFYCFLIANCHTVHLINSIVIQINHWDDYRYHTSVISWVFSYNDHQPHNEPCRTPRTGCGWLWDTKDATVWYLFHLGWVRDFRNIFRLIQFILWLHFNCILKSKCNWLWKVYHIFL